MEAVLLHGSLDQSISPYKSYTRSPSKIQPFISRGLLQAPPPPSLSRSYPPYTLQKQPPLLPLPAANQRRSGVSSPPANRKPNNGNRNRGPSLTPKKSKSPKKEEKNNNNYSPKKSLSSTGPLGPDPTELPMDVKKVLPSNISLGANICSNTNSLSSVKAVEDQIDVFSGSVVFTVSPPPPSSLPLPTFSLRPKLSCNAEAATGIDAGATDNLRRLLRLR